MVPCSKNQKSNDGTVAPALRNAAASDDEYADCFDGAEVVASQGQTSRLRVNSVAAVSSNAIVAAAAEDDATDLGSDLDSEATFEPPAGNRLFAKVGSFKKFTKSWALEFRQAVLQLDGVECILASGRGKFRISGDGRPSRIEP